MDNKNSKYVPEEQSTESSHSFAPNRPGPAYLQIERSRVRALVSERLFGTDPNNLNIDRFRLVRRIGQGSYGLVYEAYDPKLNRNVALKAFQFDPKSLEHKKLLAEAQALALLSHPNVVQVYDFGVTSSTVYIVMELIRGETLRSFSRRASPRQIFEAYLQAGKGLLAAHDQGLVHRDFKPDNVMIDSDSRVRVLDFGLAQQPESATNSKEAGSPSCSTKFAGTPKYLAPELKLKSSKPSILTDQFAFATSLKEGLENAYAHLNQNRHRLRGLARTPTRIQKALDRSLHESPNQRYLSMQELLNALEKSPRTGQKWWMLFIFVVALAGTFALGDYWNKESLTRERCQEVAYGLENIWSQQRIASEFATIRYRHGESEHLHTHTKQRLLDFMDHWHDLMQEHCLAIHLDTPNRPLSELQTQCFERSKLRFLTLVDTMQDSSTNTSLAKIAEALPRIEPLENCLAESKLTQSTRPRENREPAQDLSHSSDHSSTIRSQWTTILTKIEVISALGETERAIGALRSFARQQSSSLNPKLSLEIELLNARLEMNRGNMNTAYELLEGLSQRALENQRDDLAVEAWARHMWIAATRRADFSIASKNREIMLALASRKKDNQFGLALVWNNLGGVELARGDEPMARHAFTNAIAQSGSLRGWQAHELQAARINLALVTEHHKLRNRLFDKLESMREDKLGKEHPNVLDLRFLRNVTDGGSEASLARLETVCSKYYKYYPSYNARLAECAYETAWLHILSDRPQYALEQLKQLKTFGTTTTSQKAQILRKLLQLEPDNALNKFEAMLLKTRADTIPADKVPTWYEMAHVGDLYLGIALSQYALSRDQLALLALEHATTQFESALAKRLHPATVRRLAFGYHFLAQLLQQTTSEAIFHLQALEGASKSLLMQIGSSFVLPEIRRLQGSTNLNLRNPG